MSEYWPTAQLVQFTALFKEYEPWTANKKQKANIQKYLKLPYNSFWSIFFPIIFSKIYAGLVSIPANSGYMRIDLLHSQRYPHHKQYTHLSKYMRHTISTSNKGCIYYRTFIQTYLRSAPWRTSLGHKPHTVLHSQKCPAYTAVIPLQ